MPGYNWYTNGYGGSCAKVWGDNPSYWCSNSSQGGWAFVDADCAERGRPQIPEGLSYNMTAQATKDFSMKNLSGGILHAWHSQSWALHMFNITTHDPIYGKLRFGLGGGRQGARNWCRCDECTYAGLWCGQHQTPSWNDDRLIGGSWIIENIFDELDSPGEFFFDKNTNLIYVKANSTMDLKDFKLGILDRLINIEKTINITISNIGFRDASPTYMKEMSAPSGGDWSLHRGGALYMENVSNITINNCTFRRLDGNAIFLSRKTRYVAIEDNRFEWIGESAIATWGQTKDFDATDNNFPMFTRIHKNIFRELGIYQKQASAVGHFKAAATTIRENIMFNMPRAAINFNDMVGGADIVEKNVSDAVDYMHFIDQACI